MNAIDYRALAHAEASIREANFRDAVSMSRTRIVGDSLEIAPVLSRRKPADPNEGYQEKKARQYAEHKERERQIDALRVERDPCPLCGVRGDIGCRHNK